MPADIPAAANRIYRTEGWVDWGDWLGTEAVASRLREYRPLSEARAFARRLRLRSGAEWSTFCKSGKLPADIPAKPVRTYAGVGWTGMRDWLGTDTKLKH